MTREKSCGALVLRRADDGKIYILMIRHNRGGHRSFPKGHMEAGETEKMTAEREVMEETGIDISISSDFRRTVTYSPAPGVIKDVVYFLARSNEEETTAREGEIAEAGWVPIEGAEAALTHENDRTVLRAAMKHPELRKIIGTEY